VPIDFAQIRELLDAVAQTDVTELTLKCEEFELTVRKASPASAAVAPAPAATPAAPAPVASPPAASAPPPAPSEPAPPPGPDTSKWTEIASPMVGTFYRAAAPGESPFVEVGDRIQTSQTVCIIEAMKLMNEIEAEVAGEVMEILVENGDPVEYGQALMRVKPL